MTEIFRDVLDDPAIVLARATTAADIEDWDSLAQISLLVAIEREFKIQITLAESKSLANVGEMIDLVAGKTG
ncbi:MAG: phosphopantetheine-binding protein [Rubrivivax sp.]|nr:phosphopantetheine-binding protein [Rubrivivax sp.]